MRAKRILVGQYLSSHTVCDEPNEIFVVSTKPAFLGETMPELKKDKESALDRLFQEVRRYQNGKELSGIFDFMKKFNYLAPFNAFLLHVQKPGSQYVATAKEWRIRFNRRVKPEARPLVILWPFGPVCFVFELSDTEGDEPFPEELLNPFKVQGQLPSHVSSYLMQNLARYGVSYHEADYGTSAAGCIKQSGPASVISVGEKKVKIFYNLVVNGKHTEEEKFATITHELGHLFCGHLGTPDPKLWNNRMSLPEGTREFEAESVTWLVCERLGINNPSASYLSGYLGKDRQIPEISFETVLKAAGMVESMIQKIQKPRKELLVDTKK